MNKKIRELSWINIFVRDILLVIVVGCLQYYTYFNSKTLWFITGLLVVWISWQFTDYLNYKKLQNADNI